MNCEQLRELLEPYALGELDDATRLAVETALAHCDDERALLESYSEALAKLASVGAQHAPVALPAGLKQRVLAQAFAAPARAPARAGGGRRWQWAALAAMVCGALAVGYAWDAGRALAEERAQRVELTSALSSQREVIFEVIDSPRATRLFMRATQPGSTAYGKVFVRPDLPHVVAMAARLAAPADGQEYALWLTQDGVARRVGALQPNGTGGFDALVFDAPSNGPVFTHAELVLQARNSSTPAGSIVIAGP